MNKKDQPYTLYQPLVELTRGETVESTHYGALAIVDARGKLLASVGDAQLTTFMRSSAKPFQAIPFIEQGGHRTFDLGVQDIALMCASHSGTVEHTQTVQRMQSRLNLNEYDLQCGAHEPYYKPAADALLVQGEQPTNNHHNCSGKHTGMLAYAQLLDAALDKYLDIDHPVQKNILQAVAEMCEYPSNKIALGIDGCSAPNFALPLYNAAYGIARLCDPHALPPKRAAACQTITQAMMAHPFMVAGPDRFDTQIMEAMPGKIIAKAGAEGYQIIGIMPDSLYPGSRGIGIAIKIADGDRSGRARPIVALELLRALNAISNETLNSLSTLGPICEIRNWRNILVGQAYPAFQVEKE